MIKTQFTIYLQNKPGMLARITKLLAAGAINIEGISVAETADLSLVQLVVDKPAAAAKILKREACPFTSQNVAVLHLEDKPGALHALVRRLSSAGHNINYLYATTGEARKGECAVVVSGDDLKEIEAAMAMSRSKRRRR